MTSSTRRLKTGLRRKTRVSDARQCFNKIPQEGFTSFPGPAHAVTNPHPPSSLYGRHIPCGRQISTRSPGGIHSNPFSWFGDDEGDRRVWRDYADQVRRSPFDPPAPPLDESTHCDVKPLQYIGNSGPLQGISNQRSSEHQIPSPSTRKYQQQGPALPVGLNGHNTKCPRSASGYTGASAKKFLWAALEIGGHNPPPRKQANSYVNPPMCQPAMNMNRIRAPWSGKKVKDLLREKLKLKRENVWTQCGLSSTDHMKQLTCEELRTVVDNALCCSLTDWEAQDFFNLFADSENSQTVSLGEVFHEVTIGQPLLLADFSPMQSKSSFGLTNRVNHIPGYTPKYGTPLRRHSSGKVQNFDIAFHRTPTQMLRFGHVPDLPMENDERAASPPVSPVTH